MRMREGGNENRVRFEGGSYLIYLSVRHCEQRPEPEWAQDELCVGSMIVGHGERANM